MSGCSGIVLIAIFFAFYPPIGFILVIYYGLLFACKSADETIKTADCEGSRSLKSTPNNSSSSGSGFFGLFSSSQFQARMWATNVFPDSRNYLIIDTETTGLTRRDEVVEIGVIDLAGNTVFHSYIKPPKRRKMPPDAERVHKISLAFLKDKPTMADIVERFRAVVSGKVLISYNAEFDERLLKQTCDKYSLPSLNNRWECAMIRYAAWVGEWNSYHNDYKWQKLPSAGHDALSDCLATRKIIIEMAGGKV